MSSTTEDWTGLRGRVCVVTGATGGIGREMARAFAAVGARLGLIDRDQSQLDGLAAELEAEGAEATGFACDIADPASLAKVASASEARFGACGALVNCAAILRAGPLIDTTVEQLETTLRVNVGGALYVSNAFGRQMMERGSGSIVHVASIAGLYPTPDSGPYSASKAAVSALAKQLALEWAPHGIRCNAICPGLIRTPMTEHYYRNDEFRRRRDAVIPVGRVGAGSDIADVAVFLASERSRYVTGQNIVVDGGLAGTLWSSIPRPPKD